MGSCSGHRPPARACRVQGLPPPPAARLRPHLGEGFAPGALDTGDNRPLGVIGQEVPIETPGGKESASRGSATAAGQRAHLEHSPALGVVTDTHQRLHADIMELKPRREPVPGDSAPRGADDMDLAG